MSILVFTLLLAMAAGHAGAQTWAFAERAGGSGNDYGDHVAVDAAGNSYAIGEFQGSAQFDTVTLAGPGIWKLFLAKYNPAGRIVWATVVAYTTGTGSDIYGSAIVLDAAGNIYIGGRFVAGVTFAGDTLRTSRGPTDMLLVKVNNAGGVVWARTPGGAATGSYGEDGISSIGLDSGGNPYITGYYNKDAEFDTIALASTLAYEAFVAKYDSAGHALWARSGGGIGALHLGLGIAVDGGGNCIVSGKFFNTLSFGGFTFDAGDAEQKAFIAKFDRDGTVLWAKEIGSGGYYGAGEDIAADAEGNVYVCGQFRSTISFGTTEHTFSNGLSYAALIVKYDGGGNYLWSMQSTGADQAVHLAGICVDRDGSIFAAGSFSGTMDLGSAHLSSPAPNNSAFAVHMNAQGTTITAAQISGNASASAGDVAPSGNGSCTIIGIFTDTIGIGPFRLGSAGANDIMLARLESAGASVKQPEPSGSEVPALYPNPAAEFVHLQDAGTAERVQIFSARGMLVRESVYTGSIDLRGLPAGLYLIRAGGRSMKLIKTD
ncbi:MAG TPA: T9SS type A sorting domain-containing protein [Candidatus Kapabacteria bacterium]|nr:T9SS type A sorting domain-containing protein [Candidatus Kapabacteria bacterium]